MPCVCARTASTTSFGKPGFLARPGAERPVVGLIIDDRDNLTHANNRPPACCQAWIKRRHQGFGRLQSADAQSPSQECRCADRQPMHCASTRPVCRQLLAGIPFIAVPLAAKIAVKVRRVTSRRNSSRVSARRIFVACSIIGGTWASTWASTVHWTRRVHLGVFSRTK